MLLQNCVRFCPKLQAQQLTVVREDRYQGENAIYLGNTLTASAAQSVTLETKLPWKRTAIKSIVWGMTFYLQEGRKRACFMGVYSLLESFGFRKYSADDAVMLPTTASFTLPENEVKIPGIKYRTTSYYDARDEAYAAWHKLSSRDSWGLFVHTFEVLVPPEKYGKTHPEYFSLIDGERNPVTQLCLSNEAMFQTLVDGSSQTN